MPYLDIVLKICSALNISIAEMIRKEENFNSRNDPYSKLSGDATGKEAIAKDLY